MAGLAISRRDIDKLKKRAEGLQRRASKAMQEAHKVVEIGVRTAEVGAGAFTFGLIQGKYEGIEVAGVPLDLGAGLGLHILGFMGVGGELSNHLHNFGDGALAAYLTAQGAGAGLALRQKEAKALKS